MKLIKKSFFVLAILLCATACNADFIKVTLLGTGSPRPSVDRSGPAVLVEVSGKYLLFDTGRGVVQRLQQLDVPVSEIQNVFLTHLHSDHISALDDVWLTGWIYQRNAALTVYGPKGTESYINNLKKAYSFDVKLRNEHSGLNLDSGIMLPTEIKPGVIYSEDGVKVVISGDTTFSQNLIDHSIDVDLLIHEIMSVNSTILEKNPRLQKIQRYHTNTEQFSEVLESVKPRVAVMTHVIVVGTSDDNVLQQVIEHYEGDLYMGEDLMSFELGNSIKVIPY